jgi:hypothetical protein
MTTVGYPGGASPQAFAQREAMGESARKHGPFDDRYPVRLKFPAPSWDLRPDRARGERLD